MDLLIKKQGSDVTVIKPVNSGGRNIENIIAGAKMVILENLGRAIELDLTGVNFLDCIKIGTVIGTYHFLEFSGKKIFITVSDTEVKKALESLSFNNIEVYCGDALELAGIA